MSITALGDIAKCGKIQAEEVEIPFVGGGKISQIITNNDDGTALHPKGIYIVDTSGGNTAMTLADGIKQGDSVEIFFWHSGGNTFDLTIDKFHGATKTISDGPASGTYYKLVWISHGTHSWCMTARESCSDAAANAVANLPVIA